VKSQDGAGGRSEAGEVAFALFAAATSVLPPGAVDVGELLVVIELVVSGGPASVHDAITLISLDGPSQEALGAAWSNVWRRRSSGPEANVVDPAHELVEVGCEPPSSGVIAAGAASSPVVAGAVVSAASCADAPGWARRGFDEPSAELWLDAGFSDPDEAVLWHRRGLDPSSARAWRAIGVDRPIVAERWRSVGFSAREARNWFAIGVDDHRQAIELSAAGLHSSDVGMWVAYGVSTLAAILRLVWLGLTPADVRELREVGMSDWDLIRASQSNVDLSTMTMWLEAGWSFDDATKWLAVGATIKTATSWRDLALGDDEARRWLVAGIAPSEAGAWTASGVSDANVAVELRADGVSADHVVALIRADVGVDDVAEFIRSGGSKDDVEAWIDVSGTVEVARWMRVGITVDAAEQWASAGFAAETAAEWRDAGFTASDARRWRRAGVADANDATQWAGARFAASRAGRWIRGGYCARDAVAWCEQGVREPAVAAVLEERGIRLAELRSWRLHGFSAEDALRWRDADTNPMTAASLTSLGARPTTVASWVRRTGLPASAVGAWLKNGFSVTRAIAWATTGIGDAALAARCAPVQPEDILALRRVGMTLAEIEAILTSGWAGQVEIQRLTAADVAQLRDIKISAAAWHEWLTLCRDVSTVAAWRDGGVGLARLSSVARDLKLDPAELRTWTALGATPKQVIEAHRAGVRSADVWARQASHASDKHWDESARRWAKAAGTSVSQHAALFQMLRAEGIDWAAQDEDVLNTSASQEWLDGVTDDASDATWQLVRNPVWPVVFESSDITIILDVLGDHALAWVGVGGRGGLVGFPVEEFEVRTSKRNPSWRYLAGLAVAWFVDCCIVIHEPARATSLLESASASSSRSEANARRYRPRPSFDRHVSAVASGTHAPPRAHMVAAHIRTLPVGHEPSWEAIQRAPTWIRRKLRPNQTYVRPCRRGEGGYWSELPVYLSKYSALANALGSVDLEVAESA
jgi:hypothetical protein